MKKAPRDAENKDESIIKLTNRKQNKALSQETKFNLAMKLDLLKIGQHFKGEVRQNGKKKCMKSQPRHHILTYQIITYVHKDYELLKVNDVEIPAFMSSGKPGEQIRKKRAMAREGLP